MPIYKQWKLGLLTSYYGSRNTGALRIATHDSLSKSLINSVELIYTNKNNVTVTAGAKVGWSEWLRWQTGWLVSAQVPTGIKGLLLETRVEQLLFGDFYNSFGLENLQKFPYTCYVRLTYNW